MRVALFAYAALTLCARYVAALKTPVNQELYDRLYTYSRYAGASYAWYCSTGPNGAKVVTELVDDGTHTRCVVFRDDKKKEFVLSFRGSSAIQDFILDGQWSLVPFKSKCSGCTVHKGYNTQWEAIKPKVVAQVKQINSQYPDYNVIITGHSMGAGIASLCGIGLFDEGLKTTVYTYGQPRTGNPAYADYVDKNMPTVYRVVHTDDGIAHTPPASQGYRHHGTEYWQLDPPSAGNTFKCEGQEPPDCTNSMASGSILGSHIVYFNKGVGNPLSYSCT